MTDTLIRLIGEKARIRTPQKPENGTKFFYKSCWYPDFPLEWNTDYTGYLYGKDLYVEIRNKDEEFHFLKMSQEDIDRKCIETYPPLSQKLNDENLREILVRICKHVKYLEDRLNSV